MTDTDQVLAKVRAAAARGLENMTCLCVGEGGRTPVATCKHCHGSGYLVTDETICARVALAMVEQCEWHRRETESCTMTAAQHMREARGTFGAAARSPYAERYACMAGAHSEAADRILSALRTAVGE